MQATTTRRTLSATTLVGDGVRNTAGDSLGKIEELMIDLPTGRVAYAVLSFGGFLGMGDKLFAIPWSALKLDEAAHEFVLNVSKERLEKAPGFDKSVRVAGHGRPIVGSEHSRLLRAEGLLGIRPRAPWGRSDHARCRVLCILKDLLAGWPQATCSRASS